MKNRGGQYFVIPWLITSNVSSLSFIFFPDLSDNRIMIKQRHKYGLLIYILYILYIFHLEEHNVMEGHTLYGYYSKFIFMIVEDEKIQMPCSK